MTAGGRARWGWNCVVDPDVIVMSGGEPLVTEIWHVRATNATGARLKADVELKRPRSGGVRIAGVSRKTRGTTGYAIFAKLAA